MSLESNDQVDNTKTLSNFNPTQFSNTLIGRLPPELRNKIYRYILIIGSDEVVRLTTRKRKTPSCLALLQTCRQVNHEAYHIFYRWNILGLAAGMERRYKYSMAPLSIMLKPYLKRFWRSLGPERRRILQFKDLNWVLPSLEVDEELGGPTLWRQKYDYGGDRIWWQKTRFCWVPTRPPKLWVVFDEPIPVDK